MSVLCRGRALVRPFTTVRTNGSNSDVIFRYSTIRSYFSRLDKAPVVDPLATTQKEMSLRRFHFPPPAALNRQSNVLQTFKGYRFYSQKCPDCSETELPPGKPNAQPSTSSEHKSPPPHPPAPPDYSNYSRIFRNLARSVPHLHRPTKDDLLQVTNNLWERLSIRFKWYTIKSFRKFNADDMSAFLSAFLVGNTLWILVGTTTFVSVIFAIAKSLRLQEYLARAISDYLTAETGVLVVFESATVPKYKDSRITFQNVYISRHAKPATSKRLDDDDGQKEAIRLLNMGNHPGEYHDLRDHPETPEIEVHSADEEGQWTYFDLNVDSISVTLSLWRWLDGKGLVTDAEIQGVRGVIDRRHLKYQDEYPDPASFRHVAQPGDFQLESLKLEDVLLTVYQPDFRPYTASIFRADLKQLRKQWLFYDLLSAENMVGQFDNCLFSLHKPQSMDRTMSGDRQDPRWKRMSRFRIDGVKIDHMQALSEAEGPIAWITSGKVDAVLDIRFGKDPTEDVDIQALLGEIAANISAAAMGGNKQPENQSHARIPGQRVLARPAISAPSVDREDTLRQVVIDIDLRFRDLKAAVPLFTRDLSYINNALIRPIVAFINANRTLVPIHCRIVKDLQDFDGSWTLWHTGLSDEIALKTYDALAHHVSGTQANHRRLKTVSLWSLRVTANALIGTIRAFVDPIAAQAKV